MLEHPFGNKCEFILHDLTKDYSHTNVDIRNSYITNRKIGDRYNYIVNTRDGKLLRSSTMFICDDEGKTIGSLCSNTYITETVRFEEYLRQYNQYSVPASSEQPFTPPKQEQPAHEQKFFTNDVSQLLDYLIAEAGKQVGKPVEQMHREDKIKFVRYLDQKRAFPIAKAAERIYDYLNISCFTLYNYLDIARKESGGNSQEQVEP